MLQAIEIIPVPHPPPRPTLVPQQMWTCRYLLQFAGSAGGERGETKKWARADGSSVGFSCCHIVVKIPSECRMCACHLSERARLDNDVLLTTVCPHNPLAAGPEMGRGSRRNYKSNNATKEECGGRITSRARFKDSS